MKKFQHVASAVLHIPVAPADKTGHLQRQHFVLGSLLPPSPRMIKPTQNPPRDEPDQNAARKRSPAPQWEDSSGEGAASALESLRKLEQRRIPTRPKDDRPASD
jgi:hypothetical protein